jgi:hypothetical protein
MVKCSVLFEVRTEFLNIISNRFGFKGLEHSTPKVTPCNELAYRKRSIYSAVSNTMRSIVHHRLVFDFISFKFQIEDPKSCWAGNENGTFDALPHPT